MCLVTSNNQCLYATLDEQGSKMLNKRDSLITGKGQQSFIFTHTTAAAPSKNNTRGLGRMILIHAPNYLDVAALRLPFFDLLLFGIYCSRFLYAS